MGICIYWIKRHLIFGKSSHKKNFTVGGILQSICKLFYRWRLFGWAFSIVVLYFSCQFIIKFHFHQLQILVQIPRGAPFSSWKLIFKGSQNVLIFTDFLKIACQICCHDRTPRSSSREISQPPSARKSLSRAFHSCKYTCTRIPKAPNRIRTAYKCLSEPHFIAKSSLESSLCANLTPTSAKSSLESSLCANLTPTDLLAKSLCLAFWSPRSMCALSTSPHVR